MRHRELVVGQTPLMESGNSDSVQRYDRLSRPLLESKLEGDIVHTIAQAGENVVLRARTFQASSRHARLFFHSYES